MGQNSSWPERLGLRGGVRKMAMPWRQLRHHLLGCRRRHHYRSSVTAGNRHIRTRHGGRALSYHYLTAYVHPPRARVHESQDKGVVGVVGGLGAVGAGCAGLAPSRSMLRRIGVLIPPPPFAPAGHS